MDSISRKPSLAYRISSLFVIFQIKQTFCKIVKLLMFVKNFKKVTAFIPCVTHTNQRGFDIPQMNLVKTTPGIT